MPCSGLARRLPVFNLKITLDIDLGFQIGGIGGPLRQLTPVPAMSNLHTPPANRLLARLPAADFQRVTERMRPVELEFKLVLYKHQAPIEHVYFPNRGMASAMTIMQDGSAIEVATIGNEGVIGLSVLLAGQTSANEVLMQVAGNHDPRSPGSGTPFLRVLSRGQGRIRAATQLAPPDASYV
jgi:hypothetical protein